jgi:outer membrane scaffolding protein for murein synthesis (MipA/OmpV family)
MQPDFLSRHFSMKNLLLLIPAIFCGTCLAAPPSASTIPDGSSNLYSTNIMPDCSKDMYVGAGIDVGPNYEGAPEKTRRVKLTFQFEWSNGVFLSTSQLGTYQLGMHLSQTPGIEYGPLITLGLSRPVEVLSDNQINLGDWMLGVGGFFKYDLANDLQLTTDLVFTTGRFRGGATGDLDVRKLFRLSPHHSLALWGGVTWGNRQFAQSQYNVTFDQYPDAPSNINSLDAGVEDAHLGLNLHWDLSSQWMLNSGAYATHLTGNVADSALVQKHNGVSIYSGLAYRF